MAAAAESRRRHMWRATKAAPPMLSTTGATREPITPRSMRARLHDRDPRCLPRVVAAPQFQAGWYPATILCDVVVAVLRE